MKKLNLPLLVLWLASGFLFLFIRCTVSELKPKAIQAANPKVALSVQTDIVSLGHRDPNVEKRHPEWWLRFFDHTTGFI